MQIGAILYPFHCLSLHVWHVYYLHMDKLEGSLFKIGHDQSHSNSRTRTVAFEQITIGLVGQESYFPSRRDQETGYVPLADGDCYSRTSMRLKSTEDIVVRP
jgi:hypothetical protein